jgi:iron transport multicopper oxidase
MRYATLCHQPFVGRADVLLNLAFTFNASKFAFRTNGVIFVPPTTPVLLQILSGSQSAQDLLPNGTLYPLPPNKVVETSI